VAGFEIIFNAEAQRNKNGKQINKSCGWHRPPACPIRRHAELRAWRKFSFEDKFSGAARYLPFGFGRDARNNRRDACSTG
jgi:hypothetical protein